jgi:DtxR family Mn-dependent transcriptional regulator
MTAKEMLSASLEDYIKAIYLLGRDGVSVRPKEIIARLGVTGPSVTEALHLLKNRQLIHYVPYGPITLTAKGAQVAQEVYHRHETMKRFFIEVLGLDEQVAEEGACKMEHSASADLIQRVVLYTRFVRENHDDPQLGVIERFHRYLQRQEPGFTVGEGEHGPWA